jgi:hypothetical protein
MVIQYWFWSVQYRYWYYLTLIRHLINLMKLKVCDYLTKEIYSALSGIAWSRF